jgi:hypothetical protein
MNRATSNPGHFPIVPIARLEADHEDHACIDVAVSTGCQTGREIVASGPGEFELAGSLSRRLFIASIVISLYFGFLLILV